MLEGAPFRRSFQRGASRKMAKIIINVVMDYDKTRVTAGEVKLAIQRAVDEYFNRSDNDYDDDTLTVDAVEIDDPRIGH